MQLAFLFLGAVISLIAAVVAIVELVHYNKRRNQLGVLEDQVDHLQDALAQSELIRTQQMVDGIKGQETPLETPTPQPEPSYTPTPAVTYPASTETLVKITEDAIHALLPKELSYELHHKLIEDAVADATKKFAS